MIIAVDIGNSRTCISDSKNTWNIPTKKSITVGKLKEIINEKFDVSKVDAVSLSSVVPELTDVWKEAFDDVYSLDKNNSLFKTTYPYPNEIGQDFIAATIGANELYGAPNIVIDFGTATNINIVNKNSEFVGGIIIPGLETSLKALIGKASLLEDIKIDYPDTAIGYSTVGAIQSGLVLGEAFRVDGLIDQIENELGYPAKVITTGGWSRLMSDHLNHKNILDVELVLKGLHIAFNSK